MRRLIESNSGFTLIELVIIILIIGVLGTVATVKMQESIGTAQFEQTKQELDQLAFAIAGNPDVYSGGARSDFGFVGDNGTLPSTLDQLVQNPGWSTWNGPYIDPGPSGNDFKVDAWNANYALIDTLIRSTGSGSNIDKQLARSSNDLLSNAVIGWVRDASLQSPAGVYLDSVEIRLTYPDGAGSMNAALAHPNSDGRFVFSGVPIGNHSLRVIYIPDSDTISLPVCVLPGRGVNLDVIFPSDLW